MELNASYLEVVYNLVVITKTIVKVVCRDSASLSGVRDSRVVKCVSLQLSSFFVQSFTPVTARIDLAVELMHHQVHLSLSISCCP